jgi:hypothetical protein
MSRNDARGNFGQDKNLTSAPTPFHHALLILIARTIGSRGRGGGWNAAHEAEGKPFSLTFRICVAKEAAQRCEWTPPAVERVK